MKRARRNPKSQQVVKTPHTQQQWGSMSSGANDSMPIVPQVRPYPTSIKEGCRCESRRSPAWKAILEWATFIVATVGLYVFYSQWKAADAANRISASNFTAAQRAWLGTDLLKSNISLPNKVTDHIEWHFAVQNYGNSPAMNVRGHSRLYIIPGPTPYWNNYLNRSVDGLEPEFFGSPIFPTQSIFHEGKSGEAIDATTLSDIKAGKRYVVIIGKLFYDDIFGKSHTTQFCRVYVLTPQDKPGDLITCLSVPDKAD